MQSSLKMMLSGFEDYLILWSIAIWLVTSGVNCNCIVGGGVAAYCWVNTGVCTLPKYMIFYSNIIILLSG